MGMITTQLHNGTRVVGIDPSLASTGIAVIDGPNVATFRIRSRGTKTDAVAQRAQRLIDLTDRILAASHQTWI
jgi:Holliday junction resolvasome RuvABC endonuclease subunit